MEKAVITCRLHRNTVSWLDLLAPYFRSKSELVGHLLGFKAYQGINAAPGQRIIVKLFSRPARVPLGDSSVIGCRLPAEVSNIIKDAASMQGRTVSEWAGVVLYAWVGTFSKAYRENESNLEDWLPAVAGEIAEDYASVYAPNEVKEVENCPV